MTEETTNATLSLPPVFRPVAVAQGVDPLDAACELAAREADPGSFLWAPGDAAADCAIVLAPSEPLHPSLRVAYVAMAAAGDALGALIPPVIPVAFGWPDRIVVNGAPAGGIRLRAAQTAGTNSVPDWMVAAVTIAFVPPPRNIDPGRTPHRTALALEGCGEVTVQDFLESFARHFLFWMNRWQDDGFASVRLAWLERAAGYGDHNRGMETAGPWADRVLADLGDDGSVTFEENGKSVAHPIAEILDGQTWTA